MYPFDQNNQQQYQQYAQASDSGDYSQIDQDQAAGHVQQCAQNAPLEMQQHAYGQAVSQLPPDQRQQVVQQRPTLLQHGGRVISTPLAKVALAGLAAVAATHIWDQHQQGSGLEDATDLCPASSYRRAESWDGMRWMRRTARTTAGGPRRGL